MAPHPHLLGAHVMMPMVTMTRPAPTHHRCHRPLPCQMMPMAQPGLTSPTLHHGLSSHRHLDYSLHHHPMVTLPHHRLLTVALRPSHQMPMAQTLIAVHHLTHASLPPTHLLSAHPRRLHLQPHHDHQHPSHQPTHSHPPRSFHHHPTTHLTHSHHHYHPCHPQTHRQHWLHRHSHQLARDPVHQQQHQHHASLPTHPASPPSLTMTHPPAVTLPLLQPYRHLAAASPTTLAPHQTLLNHPRQPIAHHRPSHRVPLSVSPHHLRQMTPMVNHGTHAHSPHHHPPQHHCAHHLPPQHRPASDGPQAHQHHPRHSHHPSHQPGRTY